MSGSGDPFAEGAAEAARLAKEVQEFGFTAAQSVVERFVEMCGQFTAPGGDAEEPRGDQGWVPPPFWFRDSDESLRKLQSDMVRATDAYLGVLRQFNEASLRFFDASRFAEASKWWTPSKPEGVDLLLPQVAPGGRASARLWLHNTTSSAADGLRPWCPGLTGHSGASIAASALTCQPDRIERLEPGESRELVVTLAVGEDATPGTYHGQLLVDGLP
ncbi:MAG TPA: hypothetical protein VHS57_01555, partial [Acidimicrobiales bacterium]|nr:hypothetical protein [Acidimicrobiales bacterium]